MWIVIERLKDKPDHCWFSGVFMNYDDAQKYIAILPDRPEEFRELREIPAQEYPVLFIFDCDIQDLVYITFEQLANKLSNLKRVDDDDHEYYKYYIFYHDYRGFSPNEKYYAWDNHHHVDNHSLQSLVSVGLRAHCLGGMQGIYCCDNCNRAEAGILVEKGYEPPSQWQIIPQISPNVPPKYMVACSEECKLMLSEEF